MGEVGPMTWVKKVEFRVMPRVAKCFVSRVSGEI